MEVGGVVGTVTTLRLPFPARSDIFVNVNRRVVITVAVGCVVALWVWRIGPVSSEPLGDFVFPWLAANLLRSGVDPYLRVPFLQPPPPHIVASGNLWLYPLPAAILAWPVSFLPAHTARVLFTTGGASLLAWAISHPQRRHLWPVFLSAPFLVAVQTAQWSPWLVAATLLPALAPVLCVKPTIGAVLWLHRPSRWAVAGGAALVLVSLAVLPSWPVEWLQTTRLDAARYVPPVSILPLGPLILLAALRWRDPRARLILLLSLMPQQPLFYDQLPLFLVCRTRQQALALAASSFLGLLLLLGVGSRLPVDPHLYTLGSTYVPALWFALDGTATLRRLRQRQPDPGVAPS